MTPQKALALNADARKSLAILKGFFNSQPPKVIKSEIRHGSQVFLALFTFVVSLASLLPWF